MRGRGRKIAPMREQECACMEVMAQERGERVAKQQEVESGAPA